MEFATEIAVHAVCLVLHSCAPLLSQRTFPGGVGAVHTKCRSVTREIRARLWPVVRFRQQKHCGLGWTKNCQSRKTNKLCVDSDDCTGSSCFSILHLEVHLPPHCDTSQKSLVNLMLWLLTRHTTCFMYTWHIFHTPI